MPHSELYILLTVNQSNPLCAHPITAFGCVQGCNPDALTPVLAQYFAHFTPIASGQRDAVS